MFSVPQCRTFCLFRRQITSQFRDSGSYQTASLVDLPPADDARCDLAFVHQKRKATFLDIWTKKTQFCHALHHSTFSSSSLREFVTYLSDEFSSRSL
jgi:hypothetical protein